MSYWLPVLEVGGSENRGARRVMEVGTGEVVLVDVSLTLLECKKFEV